MATGGLYGSSTANISVASSGAESNGLYGNNTNFGGTYFEWFVFQVAASQPATPTGGSWDFTTNVGTAPSGWLNAPPSNPTNPVWVSIGIVNSRSTSSITWSTPGVFSYSGQLNGSAVPTSGTGLDGEFYIQTGVSPYAIWFKNTGTWVQVTGAALYVALTGDQTIGGTKTFSSLIQGSISGNAATATSATTAATATYATTAGSATTSGTATYATSAGSVPYSGLTGTVPTWNQNTTGNAATADYATNAGFATNANSAVVAGNVTGIVAIANGGTGASDATTARTNLGLGTAAVRNAGVALGVATLDAGGTVPLSQIPASIQGGVSYQGTWNATSNSPTLTSSVGTKGYYYVVNVAGSTNLNGITDWLVGDWAIFNGTTWEKIDNTDAVTSVNGYTGTVVLTADDVGALTNITSTDGSVTVTTPSTGVRDLSVAISGSTTNVLCLVRNTTGSTLTKGTVVYISGATGQNPTVSKAIATSDVTSAQTLGMMTADLANNSNGYVTVIGLITNIDTSAYTDGQQLYLSGTTAGAVTGTKPYAPIHLVYVAVVEHAHPTQGKLFVKVQNGYELDEIHNVSAQTPTNGQTIVYNSSTQLWEQSNSPVISGTTIDNTVIGGTTPAAGTFTTLTATGQTSLGGVAGSESLRVYTPSATGTWFSVKITAAVANIGTEGTALPLVVNTNSGIFSVRSSSFGGVSEEQFRVTRASGAVNYVQVTGAATGSAPNFQFTGSDANVLASFGTKGTGSFSFYSNGLTNRQVRIDGASAAVNYLDLYGAVASSAPSVRVGGSDTNIDLNLTPKGTGTVVANGPFTATGQTSLGGVAGANNFRVLDTAGSVNYWNVRGGDGSTTSPRFATDGTGTNIAGQFASKGTGAFQFLTGGTREQLRVTDTSSAVNYVQVTGAATGGLPVISAQGSDTDVSLRYNSKGAGTHLWYNGSGAAQFRVGAVASAVNYLRVNASVAGAAPVLVSEGTDTNIDLTLTPKGTGNVRFGTYTGTALAIAGYIEIKDASGTLRKLAVVA